MIEPGTSKQKPGAGPPVSRTWLLVGIAGAILWIALSLWTGSSRGTDILPLILTTALPLGLIAYAAIQALALARLREEAAQLREDYARLESTRAAEPPRPAPNTVTPKTPAAAPSPAAGVESPLSFASRRMVNDPMPAPETSPGADPEITSEPARMSDAAPAPGARPPAPVTVQTQADLPLGREAQAQPPLAIDDLVRALHFPQTPEDTDGFRALRRALADPNSALVVRAAQDVLTLMSQDGIYMDDLTPDRARPEIWRRFATGERGGPIADLGGVRDPEILAICTDRMRKDAVFRDAAHHFLRRFDRLLARLEPDIMDADLARLAETRTARAFMVLGRVTSVFD